MTTISVLGIILSALSYLLDIFLLWLSIFAAPFKEPEMFWIIIPIWINWFFTEFFVEKHGTSFGNAISNGAIPILASLDWTRHLYDVLSESATKLTIDIFVKFVLSVAVLAYGIFVIVAGIMIKRIIFYIGRIRWVTYVLLMITPIIYNVIGLDIHSFLAMIIFFPLYWWVIEIFDRVTPEPRVYQEDS